MLSCSWLLVYRFTTPHLNPNLKTCTRYPAAETRDLNRGRDGSPSCPPNKGAAGSESHALPEAT